MSLIRALFLILPSQSPKKELRKKILNSFYPFQAPCSISLLLFSQPAPCILSPSRPRRSFQLLGFPPSHAVGHGILALPLVVRSLHHHLLRGSCRKMGAGKPEESKNE